MAVAYISNIYLFPYTYNKLPFPNEKMYQVNGYKDI